MQLCRLDSSTLQAFPRQPVLGDNFVVENQARVINPVKFKQEGSSRAP
jgi:hypothetical protein